MDNRCFWFWSTSNICRLQCVVTKHKAKKSALTAATTYWAHLSFQRSDVHLTVVFTNEPVPFVTYGEGIAGIPAILEMFVCAHRTRVNTRTHPHSVYSQRPHTQRHESMKTHTHKHTHGHTPSVMLIRLLSRLHLNHTKYRSLKATGQQTDI